MKANLYPGRGTWPDWNDLEIQQRDRMPPHASLVPFPDLASCRHAVTDNRRYLSPYIINLNDGWESRFYPDILQLPESILSFRSGFSPAAVPGGLPADSDALALDASGALAAAGVDFADVSYPFPVTPPLVPSEQAVLVYRRTCRLPLIWGGLRKRLVLQGIKAAGHVFVNGRLAGYTQGSGLPAEFDVTASLHDGDNEVFILAYPRCDGSYLEKAETRPLFGLVGDVYFEAIPPIAIHDLQVRTSPVPAEDSWQLDLTVSLISYRISLDSPQVRISLWREDQCLSEASWTVPLRPANSQDYASPVQTAGILEAGFRIIGAEAWNDEQPHLYDLFVSIEERGSRELVCVHETVGFRQLTCRDGQILINGRPLQLRAAAWPERRPESPASPDIRTMVSILRQIKQNQLNALYIRDMPADPILLELCDIYGIYVIDEAPLTASHPLVLAAIQSDPRWQAACRERLARLVCRDRNHPCVVLWSAALFRQPAPFAAQLAEVVLQLDASRFIHILDTPDISLSLDEFHARVRLAARQPDCHAESGEPAWPGPATPLGQCYCRWGELTATLLRELKQILRPLDIRALDAANGAFLVINRRNWTPASQYRVNWLLLRNGRPILSGELDNIRTEPGAEQYIELWYGDQAFNDDADYVLRFEVSYAEDLLWSNEGEEIFFAEFQLAAADRSDLAGHLPSGRTGGRLRLESDRHHLIVSGSRFWLVFNRVNGSLESWRTGDKELIAAHLPSGSSWLSGLHGSVWRPGGLLDAGWLPAWHEHGLDRLTTQVISSQEGCDGQSAVVEMMIRLAAAGRPACLELVIRYDIRAAGDLTVFTSLTPLLAGLPPLPCNSLCLNLKRDYDQVSWFGCGPQPCLANSQHTRRTGLYNGLQADPAQGVNLPGFEAGLFPDTRWLNFKDKTGFGLQVRSDQLFGFTVRPVSPPDLMPGLGEARSDRLALAVQLFQQQIPAQVNLPVKGTWYFNPVVSDTGSR